MIWVCTGCAHAVDDTDMPNEVDAVDEHEEESGHLMIVPD